MKTTWCPKKAYFGYMFCALLATFTATAEEFDFLGVNNENTSQVQPENSTAPQQHEVTPPAAPVSDVESLANDENSVLALDPALLNNEADEVVSDYIKDLENAQTARKSASDMLAERPQKLLIKLKPHEKQNVDLTQENDEEESEEIPPHEINSTLTDQQEILSAEPDSLSTPSNEQPAQPASQVAAETQTEQAQSDTKAQTVTAEEKPAEETAKTKSETSPAPFGLTWGASKQELEATHPILEKAERDGYQNVWRLTTDAQSASFAEVVLIFGSQDKLWCIYAESKPQPDDAHASKILALYHKYYDALSKKYGNAEETFTPTENKSEQTDKEGQTETIVTYGAIGDENFLADLAAEKTSLYATFHDNEVGATLSIAADDKQTYLVLDYKNLPLMNAEKNQKINSLIQDLEGL